MIPVLTTKRLLIRPAQVEDADALHPGYVDPEAMRYWSHAPYTTFEQTQAKLARNIAQTEWRMWVITRIGDDRAIGTLNTGVRRAGVSEVGYSLLPGHWGQGLAREAVAGLLDRLFGVEGLRRVCADIDPDNAASRRLVEALGFTLEGVLRAEWETHIGIRDACIYGLLAAEWGAGERPSS